MPDTKPPPDDPAQSQRFIDMAKEVEAHDDMAKFEKTLEKLISPAPLPKPPELAQS